MLWYREIVPGKSRGIYSRPSLAGTSTRTIRWYSTDSSAMFPILLLSTTIFLSLSLLRTHLSHSLSLSLSTSHIESLEAELERLRIDQKRARERERKERERILPMVVERVLKRVGVGRDEEVEVEEERMLV
jgi:hypothetical protein